MASTCVVGLQWGDEAKGKVVDLLTQQHDIVVRFNGGANAGHTVVANGETYKLSLIPSGVLNPDLVCVIGNGVVLSPEAVLQEIDGLLARGISLTDRLWISDRAHVILPYHIEEEKCLEEQAGQALGTTRRGIGPCYADKSHRSTAVRVGDLLQRDQLRQRLEQVVPRKNRLLRALSDQAHQFDVGELTEKYTILADRLRPFVRDTFWYLQYALRDHKRLLFEAAQGTLLDVDHGSYPYVTSSNSSMCGLPSGCGISARQVDHVIGIAKAYTTRVGAGPFPTELTDAIGNRIREVGREFGTVTGRPRRCGWFDAVAVRYTALLNGINSFGLMLLDVLSGLEEINICEAYRLDGAHTVEFPVDLNRLSQCQPIYRTLPGWSQDISGCRTLADLPHNARRYLDTLEEILQLPLQIVSVGPDRAQTILVS